MELQLKTLTPLWTGGVATGQMDRLHETGILGSLRWWYEAIVRGLGRRACDPTTHSCLYDADKPNNGLCDVCRVFGATGWRRRFSLRLDADMRPIWNNDSLNIRPHGRTRGWYLSPGCLGTATMRFTGDRETLQIIKALLLFMEKYGNLGARPQLGYGRFQITTITHDPGDYQWDTMDNHPPGEHPDLRTFTFFTLQFQPQHPNWWQQISGIRQLPANKQNEIATLVTKYHTVPTMPALKNYLRFTPRWSLEIEHWLFGTLRGNHRLRSKISLSWAYQQQGPWRIDGWLYLPQDRLGQANHQGITQQLQQTLHPPHTWLSGMGLTGGSNYQAETKTPSEIRPWQLHTPLQIKQFLNSQKQGT